MESLFEKVFGNGFWEDNLNDLVYRTPKLTTGNWGTTSYGTIAINDWEFKDGKMSIDMPGVKKEDINISIKNRTITINAEHDNRKYSKNITVDFGYALDKLKAHYEDGVLILSLPDRDKERKIDVD